MGFFRDTNKKKELPELYSERHLECLENHIESHFGPYESVFHELVSPDIHVDIAIIPPSEAHNCYTLVTMGMGAHRMRVPKADKKAKPSLFARVGKWLKDMKSELKKVQWPTRKQTINNTLIVIACVIVVGVFIWIFDYIAGSAIDVLLTLLR